MISGLYRIPAIRVDFDCVFTNTVPVDAIRGAGKPEANYIVGNSSGHWPARPGSMGRPYPGHRVAVIDDQGNPVAAGDTGEVALHRFGLINGKLMIILPDKNIYKTYWVTEPQSTVTFL